MGNIFKFVFHICLLTIWVFLTSGSKTETLVKPNEGISSNVSYVPYKNVGEKLLYFSEEMVTWFKANAICRTMKGHLVSIENYSVWNAINEHLKTKPKNYYWWISANDLDSEGKFIWANTGTPMDYAVWRQGEPNDREKNEDCVHLILENGRYEMNDFRCRYPINFICERESVDK
uniref:C-type lectin domain-containing protein n=1 Tax=Glossina brevipalpis TaxID=37001 RepID=A0A1A9WA29_9MUSC